jgi:hypothetical protein
MTKRTKDQKKTASGKPKGSARSRTGLTRGRRLAEEFGLKECAPMARGAAAPGRRPIVQAPNTAVRVKAMPMLNASSTVQ